MNMSKSTITYLCGIGLTLLSGLQSAAAVESNHTARTQSCIASYHGEAMAAVSFSFSNYCPLAGKMRNSFSSEPVKATAHSSLRNVAMNELNHARQLQYDLWAVLADSPEASFDVDLDRRTVEILVDDDNELRITLGDEYYFSMSKRW